MNASAPQSGDIDEREQSFLSHLVELRARLLRAVLALLGAFICLIPFADRLYALLAAPLLEKLPQGTTMVAIDVASGFFVPIKLAFFVALMLTVPVMLYQLWAFVAPGLYRHEQKLARPLLFSATILFYVGCAFAYYLVLPVVFGFLTSVTPEGVENTTDIARYLDFVLVIFLAFGFSFEVPVAVVILVALGWVNVEQLKAARSYMIVAAFVVAAVITPPDVVSQLMLAIPMCLLYEIGLIAARTVKPRAAEADS
jgi:sec-independent protein translocase protein TatC